MPLVLILEDLHWSDYSTLDLISYLANQRERAHLLLIGTYRDAELTATGHPLRAVKQELMAKQLCREVPLEYLTEAAVSDYLTMMFPGNRFPPGLAGLIHHRTDGNPLFMVNSVNYLLENKLIVLRGSTWELGVDITKIEVGVPDNIKQMIERHVDHLGRRNAKNPRSSERRRTGVFHPSVSRLVSKRIHEWWKHAVMSSRDRGNILRSVAHRNYRTAKS